MKPFGTLLVLLGLTMLGTLVFITKPANNPYFSHIDQRAGAWFGNFLECRGIHAPDDFDWDSEGRGTKFVRTIKELLSDLTDRQQDEVESRI